MDLTSICPAGGRRIVRVQWEVGISRDGKGVHGECVQHLVRLELIRHCPSRANLGQAVGYEENKHNKKAVRGALDLEVAEERVRAEEVERLVDDVWRVAVRFRLSCRAVL